ADHGRVYLIDRDNMGRVNNPGGNGEVNDGFGPDLVVQIVRAGQAGVWGNPAFFKADNSTGILYYHGAGDVLKAYYVRNGHIEDGSQTGDRPILHSNFGAGFPGTQPVLSANGIANPTSPADGIVWELQVDNYGQSGPAVLRAFRAADFSTELYDSNQT